MHPIDPNFCVWPPRSCSQQVQFLLHDVQNKCLHLLKRSENLTALQYRRPLEERSKVEICPSAETDERTGVVTPQVRGEDGNVLTPIELESEKPLFLKVSLVDTGDRFPFYDDYMASIRRSTNPDDLRTSTLISLIGVFVLRDGNISLLKACGRNWGCSPITRLYFPPSTGDLPISRTCFILDSFVDRTRHLVTGSFSFPSFRFRISSITSACVELLIYQVTSSPPICSRLNSPHRESIDVCQSVSGKVAS